jgi:hypothetical protein
LHDEFNGLQTQWAEQHQKIVVIADHLENRALETSRQLSDCMRTIFRIGIFSPFLLMLKFILMLCS